MTQREPSAAAALFPHLKAGTPDVVEPRQQPASVAAAMFPDLVPKPQPPAPNRYRGSADLAQRCDGDPMFALMLARAGLVRRRRMALSGIRRT